MIFGIHIAELITIESVDSICRDGMDMQYIMKIQKHLTKSPKQYIYKPL